MKLSLIIPVVVLLYTNSFGQETTNSPVDPGQVIAAVKKAQASLKTVSYVMKRTDTLGTFIRTMEGSVMIQTDDKDPVFGFKFRSKLSGTSFSTDNINSETVFDGRTAYVTDAGNKTYISKTETNSFKDLLNGGGGWLIVPDLIKLNLADPSSIKQDPKLTTLKMTQDKEYYYLTLNFPDLKKVYDTDQRRKIITIDKKTMLPSAVREHHETAGSVQDLYYQIKAINVNEPSFNYNFSVPSFLKEYTQQIQVSSRDRQFSNSLIGRELPIFKLTSFKKDVISSDELKGKVVLLDFWEAWCSPCVESLPKVQHLYEKYKDKGFAVYGVSNDLAHLENAKTLVTRLGYSFPMLIGNDKFKKDYKLTGTVPLYMLIDKKGIIKFVTFGYPDNMEELIKAAL